MIFYLRQYAKKKIKTKLALFFFPTQRRMFKNENQQVHPRLIRRRDKIEGPLEKTLEIGTISRVVQDIERQNDDVVLGKESMKRNTKRNQNSLSKDTNERENRFKIKVYENNRMAGVRGYPEITLVQFW